MAFPPNSRRGSATAGYPIRIAAHRDDDNLSIWDVVAPKPLGIANRLAVCATAPVGVVAARLGHWMALSEPQVLVMPCCPSHFTQQTVTNPGRAMGLQPGFGLTYVDRAGALDAECTWVLDRCRATCQEFVG